MYLTVIDRAKTLWDINVYLKNRHSSPIIKY